MDFTVFIIKVIILIFIISGVIIFFLHRYLISNTEGAVKRLNDEIAKATEKQTELSKKIKEANKELEQRTKEAREMANKMRAEVEEETKTERDKIISKARQEGEEIIEKALKAKEKLKKELEKDLDIKTIKYGMTILNQILSEKVKGVLNDVLLNEFLDKLTSTDMSNISPEINAVDVVTLKEIDDTTKSRIKEIIKGKLNRDIEIKSTVDAELGGGVMLKFGSMALDGSIKNLIREMALSLHEKVENDEST